MYWSHDYEKINEKINWVTAKPSQIILQRELQKITVLNRKQITLNLRQQLVPPCAQIEVAVHTYRVNSAAPFARLFSVFWWLGIAGGNNPWSSWLPWVSISQDQVTRTVLRMSLREAYRERIRLLQGTLAASTLVCYLSWRQLLKMRHWRLAIWYVRPIHVLY